MSSLGGSIYSATRLCFDFFGWKDKHSNGGTCVDPLPMPSIMQRRILKRSKRRDKRHCGQVGRQEEQRDSRCILLR